jgi:hypothetical protein
MRTVCSRTGHYRRVPCCRSLPDKDFRNSSVVGALKDDKHQVAGRPVERLESLDWLERPLKGRVTMLRDQTTRSKLAARQPNDRDRDRRAPYLLPLEDQQSGSDCRDSRGRPDRLIHGCDRHGGW